MEFLYVLRDLVVLIGGIAIIVLLLTGFPFVQISLLIDFLSKRKERRNCKHDDSGAR